MISQRTKAIKEEVMTLKPTRMNIRLMADAIRRGLPAIFPAGTVFGMGGLASSPELCGKIAGLKGGRGDKSFLVNAASLSTIRKIAHVNRLEQALIRAFMPGPLTIALKVKPGARLAPGVIRNDTVGVRIPDSRVLLSIIRAVGEPIISTSCNLSARPPATNAKEAEKIFPDIPAMEAGEPLSGIPSTIVEVSGSGVKILRVGAITEKEIEAALSRLPH
jgi:L-threonylcarbamoyladenylate synthase